MSQPIIISIEGNIGTGKSTIVQELHKRYQNSQEIIFVKEPVDIWETIKDKDGRTIIEKFYENQAQYAFQFQMMALTTRLSVLRKTIQENKLCKVVICERSIEADRNIFAKMLYDDGIISEIDYSIYNLLFKEYINQFNIDGFVYINSTAETCYNRVTKRSRTGENNIELSYLEKCKNYHDDWLCNLDRKEPMSKPVIEIDTNEDTNYDMNDDNDPGNKWIQQIESFITSITNDFDIRAHLPISESKNSML